MARNRRTAAATIAPSADQPTDTLIALLNTAFEGYPLDLDRAGFQRLLVRQQVDLSLSRVALEKDVPVALGLVARRGWSSRLALMGVHPDARRRGVGTALTRALVEEAKARGDRRYELEVIDQNQAGVRLYQQFGFETQQHLLEFRHPALPGDPPGAPPPLLEVDVAEAAKAIVALAEPNLPWPVSGESLTLLGPPVKAYRLGSAHAIVEVPASGEAQLLGMVVPVDARRKDQGRALLHALRANHPEHSWHVPANCPERFGPFFKQCGFQQGELRQLHMRLELR